MSLVWLAGQGLETLPQYLTALAIGLLIGLERERNPAAKAGLRTCALVALAAAISATLAAAFDAPALIAVGAGAVALMVIAAYYHHHEDAHERDPGTTTIATVIVCYLLGALALTGRARLAVILATVLLYFKAEPGGAARKLERRELVSILQFAVIAFVVLPLLPDRGNGHGLRGLALRGGRHGRQARRQGSRDACVVSPKTLEVRSSNVARLPRDEDTSIQIALVG